jgi:hypothetical protein
MKSLKTVQSELASFQERGITVKNAQGEEISHSMKGARPSTANKSKDTLSKSSRPSQMNPDGGVGPSQDFLTPFIPTCVAEFFFADEKGDLPKYLDL